MARVLLADADSATRKGLTLLLNRKLGVTDIGEAVDGDSLAQQLASCKPDLLILDWSLPNRPTLDACRQLHDAAPLMKCVILSVNGEDVLFAEALGAVFIHKSTPAEKVLGQLKALLSVNS